MISARRSVAFSEYGNIYEPSLSKGEDSTARRFPPPWSAHRVPGSFLVSDATGCRLVYCYADFQGRSSVMGQMDAATAEWVAHAIAKLPAALKGERADLGDIPAGPYAVEDSDGMFRVNSPGFALGCV